MGNIVSSRFFLLFGFGFVSFCFILFVLAFLFSPSQFVISLFTTLFHFNDRCMRDMGIDYLFIGNFVCMLLISLIRSLRGVSIQLFHIIVIVDSNFFRVVILPLDCIVSRFSFSFGLHF